ncbi:MAG TPA: hydrogenase maturation protease [Polyangiaceae bacterium]
MNDAILVAGVGNIFLGDDGFGVEVARRLAMDPPNGAKVVDFGIRGVQLAYELLDGYRGLVLVDALSRGEPPGTLYVFQPELSGEVPATFVDAHGLDPASVLSMMRMLGGSVQRAIVIGCEPESLDERMGLSAPVERAVDEAVRVVRREVARFATFGARKVEEIC